LRRWGFLLAPEVAGSSPVAPVGGVAQLAERWKASSAARVLRPTLPTGQLRRTGVLPLA